MGNVVEEWRAETQGRAVVGALKKNGFEAQYLPDAAAAAAYLRGLAAPGLTVGFGGSMTLRSLEVAEAFRKAGAKVLDHNAPGLAPAEKLEILRAQLTCDLFISGSNALTLQGELVNVDGNGNRVAALSFGPRKVVVVVGINKVVASLEEAQARLELVAAPMNNRRLERTNPCVAQGHCVDCRGEGRICRVYSVLRRRPALSDFTVLVVGESLGY